MNQSLTKQLHFWSLLPNFKELTLCLRLFQYMQLLCRLMNEQECICVISNQLYTFSIQYVIFSLFNNVLSIVQVIGEYLFFLCSWSKVQQICSMCFPLLLHLNVHYSLLQEVFVHTITFLSLNSLTYLP